MRIILSLFAGFILTSCQTFKNERTKPSLVMLPIYGENSPGGFSGLALDISQSTANEIVLWTLADRGPNLDEIIENDITKRPFLSPNFQPRVMKIKADLTSRTARVIEVIYLKEKDGSPLTGLPPCFIKGDKEAPVDANLKSIPCNKHGIDPESIAIAQDGHIWLGEEYLPSILEFDETGHLLRQLVPKNYSNPKKSIFPKHRKILPILPAEYSLRKLNRGFEALAIYKNDIFAMLQSPLPIAGMKNPYVRVTSINLPSMELSGDFLYKLDSTKVDKIGDMSFDISGNLFVIEQDGEVGPQSHHKIKKVNFKQATNLVSSRKNGDELIENIILQKNESSVRSLEKSDYLDLVKIGYADFDKVEGLAFLNENCIAFVNDNDFSLNKKTEKSKDSYLGIWCKGP